MLKILLCSLFCLCVLKSYAQHEADANQLYQVAEKLFNANPPSIQGYRQALTHYRQVLKIYQTLGGHELQRANCHLRMGALLQTFGQWEEALNAYRQSIEIKQNIPGLSDSLLLDEYVYSGNIHYLTEDFDSAAYYYYLAEDISASYHVDKKWLYNSMGVLYFTIGNYDQSINYYTKTLEVLNEDDPYYESDVVTIRNNLALSYTRLGNHQHAITQYEGVLSYEVDDQILYKVYQNLGWTFYKAQRYDSAVYYLQRALDSEEALIRINALNHLGGVYLITEKYDSASFYFNKSLALNQQALSHKNLALGGTYLGLARIAEATGNFEQALQHYQQALISVSLDFEETQVSANPDLHHQFISLLTLFEILQGKAHAFFAYYTAHQDLTHAEQALATSQVAIDVAKQLQKTYDTDDAKLFFVQTVYPLYEEAIQTAFQLYEVTRREDYKLFAFEFAEISKATVLTEMLKELEIKSVAGIDEQLLQEEKNLKQQITKLRLAMVDQTDTAGLTADVRRVNDLEIALSRTIRSLQDNSDYYALKYQQDSIDLGQIQSAIDRNDMIVEYFLGDSALFSLLVSKDALQVKRVPLPASFSAHLTSVQNALYEHQEGQTADMEEALHQLYQVLIAPVAEEINTKHRLIIVPDGQLHYLPFEILTPGGSQEYLLENHVISYAYSATLLEEAIEERNKASDTTILAMAPFASEGGETTRNGFEPLGASKTEVEKIGGSIYLEKAATKQVFLKVAKSYGIIHLATHARADSEKPLNSFIAFYPEPDSSGAGYRLYTDELYNYRLDSAKLVVLSACETGGGKLIRGEGIISLARAFAYAGCPNIVTTLWQASDRAAAMITASLHQYLKEGYSKDDALRLAKLDYLADNPLHRDPYYWANFIFIGDPAPIYPKTYPWGWYVLGSIVLMLTFWLFRKKLFGKT